MSVSWDNCLLSGRGGGGFSNVPETLFPEHKRCNRYTLYNLASSMHLLRRYIGIQQVVENEHFNDQFWFFAVPQFWLFLSLLYMYLRCFQVILGKNTHGPRLAAILKFRKFYKGKRPKISKIDKFQRSFVAKGCVLQEKVIKQKIFKIAFPTIYTAVLVALKCLL